MRAIAIACAAAVLAGCGGNRSAQSLPPACKEGPAAIVKALAAAPAAVTVQGTRISDCFNRDATSDDTQIVGGFLLAVAQELGDRARAGDDQAALRLGYLIGAARRGARRSGLGDEIVRRLEAETTVGAARKAAYDRGLRAGSASG